MEGSLLHSRFTDLNVHLTFNNTFTETHRRMFDQISGYYNLANLTHKIRHRGSCSRDPVVTGGITGGALLISFHVKQNSLYRNGQNAFFLKNYLFIYLFIYGCVGSSFLCEGFL